MGWGLLWIIEGNNEHFIMIDHRYLLSNDFYSPLPSLVYSADGAGHFQIRYVCTLGNYSIGYANHNG